MRPTFILNCSTEAGGGGKPMTEDLQIEEKLVVVDPIIEPSSTGGSDHGDVTGFIIAEPP